MGSEADVDALFVRFCRTGDARALGEAYDRVASELFRIALHTTHDVAQAEDVLQATFVAAIERRASFDTRQRAMPWLVGILANEAKRARDRARREIDPARVESGQVPAPESDAERAELAERLDEALAKLPAAFRPVLVLRFKHDLSAGEIAEALGIPPGTVRSQLARGTEQLRRHLPAGLAGAWLASLVPPARGLELVREAVVAHAMALPTSVAASAALSGVIAVKKVLIGVAVAAVAATAWIAWPAPQPAKPQAREREARPLAVAPSALPSPEEPSNAREVADANLAASASVKAAAPAAAASMPSTGSLLVRVLASEGDAPIAGEVVLVTPFHTPQDAASVARTDEHGAARFDELALGATFVRSLRGGETTTIVRPGEVTELTLRMRAGASVEGSVQDALGRAVAGAEIWVSERYRTNLGHVLARADERGRFELTAISADHYLCARAKGYAATGLRSVRGVPGDTLHVDFVLEREGVVVRGHVVSDRGLPVEGVRVILGDELPKQAQRLDDGSLAFASPPERAITDAHGEFEVTHALPGMTRVQARAPGYAPFDAEYETRGADHAPLEIMLIRGATVVGRVTDAEGRTHESILIHCGDIDRIAGSFASTKANGSFELGDLPAGVAHVVAEHAEFGHAEIELMLAPGEVREWNPKLAPSLAIRGRVLDERRAPLANWQVVAVPGGDPSLRMRSQPTKADGTFTVDVDADEPHALWVQSPGEWRDFPALIVPDVRPSPIALELVVTDNAANAGRIVVRVLSPDGKPVAGAELEVWHEPTKLWREFVSDGETGRIEVANVPPGAVELDLRHAEYPWIQLGRRELAAGETLDLGDILFSEPGRLRAHLRGVDAETLSGVHAMLSDASDRESGVARIGVGAQLVSGPLAAGRHTLVLRGDFVRTVKLAFDVVAGADTELDIALERCPMRRVVFEMPAGAARPPWLSCSVQVGSGQPWFGNVGAAGPFEAHVSLPPGDYHFMARGDGGWAADVELAIGEDLAPLVVRLSKP